MFIAVVSSILIGCLIGAIVFGYLSKRINVKKKFKVLLIICNIGTIVSFIGLTLLLIYGNIYLCLILCFFTGFFIGPL